MLGKMLLANDGWYKGRVLEFLSFDFSSSSSNASFSSALGEDGVCRGDDGAELLLSGPDVTRCR